MNLQRQHEANCNLYTSLPLATHSSTLTWKIHGVAKSWTQLRDFTFTFTFMHWRRKWQPTPVFLPGESQGRRSLVGCHLWGCTESDTTEVTQQQQHAFLDPTVKWWLFIFSFHSISHFRNNLRQVNK